MEPATKMNEMTQWADYGLHGLVIFALFGVLLLLVKWLVSHIDKQAVSHKEERAEWRDSAERRSIEFSQTIENTSARFADAVSKSQGNQNV